MKNQDLTTRIETAIKANFNISSETAAEMAADRLHSANPAIPRETILDVAMSLLPEPMEQSDEITDWLTPAMDATDSDY